MPAWIIIAIGYLIGSVPTAYLAGRFLKRGDIRTLGDANSGAANAFRELGKAAGVTVYIVDVLKGAAVILIAQTADALQPVVLMTGAAAVIGHTFPVWLGFRGGRGVAVLIGTLYVLVTIPALIITAPVLLIVYLARATTPALAFLFIVLIFLDWWWDIPAWVIIYQTSMAAFTGVITWYRSRGRVEEKPDDRPAD